MLKMYTLRDTIPEDVAKRLEIRIVSSPEEMSSEDISILIVPNGSEYISKLDVAMSLHDRGIIVVNKNVFDRIHRMVGNDRYALAIGIMGFGAFAYGTLYGIKEAVEIKELEEMWEKSSIFLENNVEASEPAFKSSSDSDSNKIVISVDKNQAQFSLINKEQKIYMLVKVKDSYGRLTDQGILKGVVDKPIPRQLHDKVLKEVLMKINEILQEAREFNEGRFLISVGNEQYEIYLKDVSDSVGEKLLIKDKQANRYLDRKEIRPDEENIEISEIKNPLLFIDKED